MELADWRFSRGEDSVGVQFPDGELVVAYLEHLRTVRGRSPQTLRSYVSTLEAWVQWPSDNPLLQRDRAEMEAFLERTRTRRGRGRMGSPATRKREASCLRAFYTWCVNQQHIAVSPARALEGPTVHNVNPRPIDDGTWLRVWGSELSGGERLMLGLGYYCGLRRQEIAQLQCEQITNTRIVDFVRKGGGEHTLPWADMVGIYEDRLGEVGTSAHLFSDAMHRARRGSGPVLPWTTSGDPQTVNKRLYVLQARLSLPQDLWFTPHQLRHSCATNLLRAGVPLHLVSSLLNHTNPAVTMRYVRAGGRELREWRDSHP